MSARCKPGDLAVVVVVKSVPELLGRLVIIDRLYQPGELVGGMRWDDSADDGIDWVIRAANGGPLPVDDELHWRINLSERPYPDFALRPIRPNEGEDESLSWARPRVEELA